MPSRALSTRGPLAVFLIALLLGAEPCDPDPIAQFAFEADLARRWAPIHYQDVDRTGKFSLGGRSDFITAADFDGDWRMNNSWESLGETRSPVSLRSQEDIEDWLRDPYEHPALPYVYYSVVTTESHWYIIYAFFHPRDWCETNIPFVDCVDLTDEESPFSDDGWRNDLHENDLEGLLLIVRRPSAFSATSFGTAEAMITVSHTDFFSYVNPGASVREGEESIDGFFANQEYGGRSRPCTFQEAKGHGLKALYDDNAKADCRRSDRLDDDYVEYVPGDRPDDPTRISGWPKHQVRYELIPIETTLWDRRDDLVTFAPAGIGVTNFRLLGDNGVDNSAVAPWGWDDTGVLGDGILGEDSLPRGWLATYPAGAYKNYFSARGPVSDVETSNFYVGIRPSGFPEGY